MRRAAATALGAALALSLTTAAAPVRAEKPGKSPVSLKKPKRATKGVGPRVGSGQRRIAAAPKAAQAGKKPTPEPTQEEPKSDRPAHQKGPKPRKPRATLPEGAPRAEQNHAARRQVAVGATATDLKAGKNDPELRALTEADRVLFPRPLRGVTPGWSWGLPSPRRSRPDVVASGLPPSPKLEPQTDSDAVKQAEWLRSLTMPDIPVRLDPRVVKYLSFYRDSRRGRAIARVWVRKSGRYVPALKAAFARAGLPTDLVWLSLIESGHNPTIKSPAGAAGLWQFIPEAGRIYGLTVDRWVDERLDPPRATEAAIGYLSDLHKRFGNWDLAMAAYNMGYGGLSRAIRKFNSNDFWELSRHEAGIPWETTLYVPKILAIAIVMNNKRAFGLDGINPDPPISFDTVRLPSGVTIGEVARAAEMSVDEAKRRNAHLLKGRTPPSKASKRQKFRVYVSRGKGVLTQQKLAKARSDKSVLPYIVRFGDTVEAVAAEQGTTAVKLRRLNAIARRERLEPGTVLLVPRKRTVPAAQTDEAVVVVPARQFKYVSRRVVYYRVRRGDTLGAVADAFGVTLTELSMWNSIDRSANLVSGMVLQLYVPKKAKLSHVRYLDGGRSRVLVAGSDEFFDHFEGLKGRKRIAVTVLEKDTLRKIGKRYGLSVGSMERINRMSRSTKLRPGDKVIVYARAKDVKGAPKVGGVQSKPLPPVKAPAPEALPPVPGKRTSAR